MESWWRGTALKRALSRVLRVGDPQFARPARVGAGGRGFADLVWRGRRAVDRGCAAIARGQLDRVADPHVAPTVKQRLAATGHLFDWLVTGQIVPMNPGASVRGSSHTVCTGKTPVLDASEVRQLLDSIDVSTPAGLRDRALIALMVFSFARVGAALATRVENVYVAQVRLREKGGQEL